MTNCDQDKEVIEKQLDCCPPMGGQYGSLTRKVSLLAENGKGGT
jgi:hypothetical protein